MREELAQIADGVQGEVSDMCKREDDFITCLAGIEIRGVNMNRREPFDFPDNFYDTIRPTMERAI